MICLVHLQEVVVGRQIQLPYPENHQAYKQICSTNAEFKCNIEGDIQFRVALTIHIEANLEGDNIKTM